MEVELELNSAIDGERAMRRDDRDRDIVINAKELRQILKDVVEAVRAGKSYTVLYRSRPAFRIVPVDEQPQQRMCPLEQDPLYKAGPLFDSGTGDVGQRHDEILYGELQ
jgi:prevent-host-death family protein